MAVIIEICVGGVKQMINYRRPNRGVTVTEIVLHQTRPFAATCRARCYTVFFHGADHIDVSR